MKQAIDLSGRKFGKLTVLYRVENHISKNGNTRPVWHCKCDCGNEIDVLALNLTRNHTKSCGCARTDGRKKLTLDITGQRFGNLVAIKKVDNPTKKGTKWLFKCDCGNEVEALWNNVKNGRTTTCGRNCGLKNHPETTKKRKGFHGDMTGERYGMLTVVERVGEKNGYALWKCICDCGNEKIVTASSLRYGNTKSCGCLYAIRNKENNFEDLTNQRFGKLTVIRQAESKYGKRHWVCKCDCGNETIVSVSGLKSGHTQSCGCYQDEVASNTHFVDLSGQRFGKLTVIRRAENSRTGLTRFECKCDCGNNTIVSAGHLLAGRIQSCGCWKYSKMEEYVVKYFNELGLVCSIDYECQKKYPDLFGLGGKQLSYDFIVYKNSLPVLFIECQGQQHYFAVDYFGGEKSFKSQQEHDMLKKKYAKKLGVPLLEIPYTVDTYKKIKQMLNENLSFS